MYKLKRAQAAMEFLLIFVFIMALIGVLIGVIGSISIDVGLSEKRAEVDDFAYSILNEFTVMQKVQGGYNRTFKIETHFMERFNLQIQDGYLIIDDKHTYGDSEDRQNETNYVQWYLIPGDFDIFNVSVHNSTGGEYNASSEIAKYITITKEYDSEFDGINILN